MITIIDFDDSFTHNIYSELCQVYTVRIIHFTQLKQEMNSMDLNSRQVFIFGPGPGHPKDYDNFTNELNTILKKKNILSFGICLGHQLIWNVFGLPSSRAHIILHGQSEKILFKDFFKDENLFINVQRYNSLTVKISQLIQDRYLSQGWRIIVESGEIYASRHKNVLTYQFHPESIGTNYKTLLYSPIRDFLLS